MEPAKEPKEEPKEKGTTSAFLAPIVSERGNLSPRDKLDWQMKNSSVEDITPEFRKWLLDFVLIEAVPQIPARQISGGSLPTAAIVEFAGGTAPAGWLLCDGSAVDRTTYASLFKVIGTTYGTGDGSTTFNLPDHRGRVPVGLGQASDVASLGNNEGAVVGVRGPRHAHTVTDTGHSHAARAMNGGATNGGYLSGGSLAGDYAVAAGNAVVSATTGITVGIPGVTDAPAYLTVNFIIKH